MAQIAAFGRSQDSESDGGIERQISNLRDLYENALLLDGGGDHEAAESAYEEVLQHSIFSDALDNDSIPRTAILLKSLTLKNLGALHIRLSRFSSGLNYYILAAQQTRDGWKDCSLLSRIGACARELDLLAVARQCFERCLHCQPKHSEALQNLLDISVICGDHEAFLRLNNYAHFIAKCQWSPDGLERLPSYQKDEDVAPLDRFCKKRKIIADPPSVHQIELLWQFSSNDQVTFAKFFDFLLLEIDRFYCQRQPFEALTAPISIKLKMVEDKTELSSQDEFSLRLSDSCSKSTSSHSESVAEHVDRTGVLLKFLHQALPQQEIRLESHRLVFLNQSSPSSPIMDQSLSYDEPSAVLSLLESLPAANSGIMTVAQYVWNVMANSPPPSLSPQRILSIRQALKEKMLLASCPSDTLLAAEITFDQNPEAVAALIPHLKRHLDNIFLRGCWLLGLWHMHYRRRATACLYFSKCAERIGDRIVVRDKCNSDRFISSATIAVKLTSLSIWELCEGVIAGDEDCIQCLYELCINGDSEFPDVPHSVQVAAFEIIRGRFSSCLVLLRLIIASVPSSAFDTTSMKQFSSCVEALISSEALTYLPGQLVDEVCHALSQALYLAINDNIDVEFMNLVVIAIVQFSSRYGAIVSRDSSSQVKLFRSAHEFLSHFEGGCSACDCRFLHFGLEFVEDVRDSARFDAISSIYCCLYGPLDLRFECHQAFETIRLPDQKLPSEKCRKLLDYCFAADSFLGNQDRTEFAARSVSLLRLLRVSIVFPEDLQPKEDFVTKAFTDIRYQLPFVTWSSNHSDICHRYYDYFAQRLVNLHSICSYATRLGAATTSDMNTLKELLHCDLRLHPRRFRSWNALAWCFLHQRSSFLQGVRSAIDVQAPELDEFFEPLLRASRCLRRAELFFHAESDCVEELKIFPKLPFGSERILQTQLVLNLRLLEYSAHASNQYFSTSLQLKRVQRVLSQLPESSRMQYIHALTSEWIQAPASVILSRYASAASSIPDALYALHALRLDLALSAQPDWDLISTYPFSQESGTTLQSILDDVAAAFIHLCEQNPEFFRPALRLAQVALLTDSVAYADRAVSELSLFINDKTRLRRVRPRKGSLAFNSSDSEFVRALLFDPNMDFAEEDCYVASLVLCRRRGNWEELESIYYNVVRPRKDKTITLMYASVLVSTLNEWAESLRENVTIALRDSLFKRAFECCLDLMRGQRDAQVFMPALLVLPYRIVNDGASADGDILPSDVVNHEEVRQSRDWCAELQCARSVRNALRRLAIPIGTYNLKHHIVPIEAEFRSFHFRR